MKKILLIAVGVMLSAVLVGCNTADKAKEIYGYVHTLKEQGCGALSESAQKTLVMVIKAKYSNYPPNGICDPNWVRNVLLEKLYPAGNEDVLNESNELGYKASSWHGQLDNANGISLLLEAIAASNNSSNRLYDGFSVDTTVAPLVYVAFKPSNTSGSSGSRLHLYRFV